MAFNAPISTLVPRPRPSDWVRPADWITITDTANEVQFLVADTGTKAFTILTRFTQNSGTNIYIDWGDGVTDTVSNPSETSTSHVYSTGGTPCSRGYNTFKIRVYGDATCVITNAQHIPNFATTGGSVTYNIGLLEVYMGDGTMGELSSFTFSSQRGVNSIATFLYLEYVKLPVTVPWTSQMSYMFQNCDNLYKVVMPTSAPSLTDMSQAFQECKMLRDIAIPSNATAITSMAGTFSGCQSLRTVSFPTTLNSCTSLGSCFYYCQSLINITLPSIDLVTTFTNAFGNCLSAQWIKFTSLPAPSVANTTITWASAFSTCSSLQNVYLPPTCAITATNNMLLAFQLCVNLKNITFPTNFIVSNLSNTFITCSKLTNVIFQNGSGNLTDMSACFSGCTNLVSVTLPANGSGSGTSFANTFFNCASLTSVTIPSSFLITSLLNTFSGCTSIASIVLPSNAQNNCSTMGGMCTNCVKLESIVMPTSLNAVSSLAAVFGACYSLKSVVFPATMNTVTSAASAFGSCYSLTSITLPTSMTACSNFTNVFNSCFSITSITMPATVAVNFNTSYNLSFTNCYSLRTLTLSTTQTTALTNLSSIFTNCGSLVTINNLDNFGSTTATPLVAASTINYANLITSLTFKCPFSILGLNGQSATNFNRLNSLRLLNAGAGQWTGASPQINVSYCDLDVAALDQLFTDLTTIVGKTIDIKGCTGASGCTRSIATAKGWTVSG